MRNISRPKLIAVISFVFAFFFTCSSLANTSGEANSDADLVFTGTVRYIPLEGGFFGIVSDDGGRYDPSNLKEEFCKDGLRVRVRAKALKDVVGFHMWGSIIEVVEIEKI